LSGCLVVGAGDVSCRRCRLLARDQPAGCRWLLAARVCLLAQARSSLPVSTPVSPCADEPPVAASGASATSLLLPAASSSSDVGVVVVAVSALVASSADEPLGAPAASPKVAVVAPAAADARYGGGPRSRCGPIGVSGAGSAWCRLMGLVDLDWSRIALAKTERRRQGSPRQQGPRRTYWRRTSSRQ
jgi:hypothetical protein